MVPRERRLPKPRQQFAYIELRFQIEKRIDNKKIGENARDFGDWKILRDSLCELSYQELYTKNTNSSLVCILTYSRFFALVNSAPQYGQTLDSSSNSLPQFEQSIKILSLSHNISNLILIINKLNAKLHLYQED